MKRRTFLKGTGAVLLLPSLATAKPFVSSEGGYVVSKALDQQKLHTLRNFSYENIAFLCRAAGVEDFAVETKQSCPGWVRIWVDREVDHVRRVLENYRPCGCEMEVELF